MLKKTRIRRGDTVMINTGKYKKMTGEVIQVCRDTERLKIKGINVVRRHIRPSVANPEGVVEKEASVHISNVALFHQGAPTRVHYKIVDGVKKRIAKTTGDFIDA